MKKSNFCKMRAGAMIEASLVLPVALFLIVGLIDLGRALNQYMYTVRVSYEGARFMAEQRNLNLGCMKGMFEDGNCTEAPQGSPYWTALTRVKELLNSQGIQDSDLAYKLDVSRINNQYVRIKTNLKVGFKPYFALTPIRNLEVNMTAPFLFPDNTQLTAVQNQI